jgi:hypothetical protein
MTPVAYDDENQNWSLLIFLGALGQMFQQADTLAHNPGGPWTGMLDIDQIPDEGLPWLGQFIGVRVNMSLSTDEQRQQIRDHEGWNRGRPEAIIKAVQRFLSGSMTVIITERDTGPYHFNVLTYATETPAGFTYDDIYSDFSTYEDFYDAYGSYGAYYESDPQIQIEEAINAAKPAGLLWDWTIHSGSPGSYPDYEQVWLDWATYQKVFDNYQTYQDLYINP